MVPERADRGTLRTGLGSWRESSVFHRQIWKNYIVNSGFLQALGIPEVVEIPGIWSSLLETPGI